MFMSIFSSIDALCAESIGLNFGFPWAPAPSTTSIKQDAAAKVDDLKKGKEVNSSSPPPTKAPGRMRTRTPRFAPELDGLHCFETIVPY